MFLLRNKKNINILVEKVPYLYAAYDAMVPFYMARLNMKVSVVTDFKVYFVNSPLHVI